MTNPTAATVYLVGAGPGDPGLLTLRGVECLALADFVLYDKLVSTRLLDYAPVSAERVCVTELPGCHPQRWPHIHQALIVEAKKGRTVVRLKGGDPLLFGRGGEEAEALRTAGVPYEIVPGVTSALAAGAYAEVPLTHRARSSAVAFVTGHEDPLKADSRLDWEVLARFPGTLAVYMGMARLTTVVRVLLENGKPGDTPTAVVHAASTGDQQTLRTTLAELPIRVKEVGMSAPAIVFIGEVAALKPEASWFERRPLFHKRVLVTRPRGQAAEFVRRLELLGAVPVVLPAVEIGEPTDWAPADDALRRLGDFDWLVFTSPNGVRALVRRLSHLGRDLRALGGVRLAAIGPGTAEALRSFHLNADLIPATYRAEELAAALREVAAGRRVLLARADRGRDLLRQELSAVAAVEQVTVYAQADAIDPSRHADIFDALRRGEIDYITLTSSNIARALLRALDGPTLDRIRAGTTQLVSISPVTSAAVGEWGLPIATEAGEYTPEGVLAALIGLATGDDKATR